ncbi:MAG: putative addiction module antidote protein [bacterium]|nr:putative addiction module antidote protein [bacterium]
MKHSKSYRDEKLKQLQNPEYASIYLETAIEEYHQDQNRAALLIALRDIIEARDGISKFAQKTQLTRQALYKSLSPNGNPRLSTLDTVLNALGYQIAVQRTTIND